MKSLFEKSVTLCAIDSVFPRLSSAALERSSKQLPFEKIYLFSDQNILGNHANIKIDKLTSIAEYNRFILQELNKYISTDFVLIVQWDGFIINPNMWRDEFFDYDYIGAVWPQFKDQYNVGNGGFTLRSKKLLQALTKYSFADFSVVPEDIMICRNLRPELESKDRIRFASTEIARQFSFEQENNYSASLGFHGLWNMIQYIDDDEGLEIIQSLPKNYFKEYLVIKTFMSCFFAKRERLMLEIYISVVREIGEDTLIKTLNMALKYNIEDISAATKKSRRLFVAKEINHENN
jgi:hypothetical protein